MAENAKNPVTAMRWRRLYLVRHGATNYGGVSGEGALPGTQLTELGRRQVIALAELMNDLEFDLIVSSPLGRARETAAILAAGRELEIEIIPELEEIRPGDVGSTTLADIYLAIRRFFAGQETTWETGYLGGETYGQLRERVSGVVKLLGERPGWRRALLVAHGGVNNAMLSVALGLQGPRLPAIEQDFACLNIVDLVENRPVVRLVNFTAYDAIKAKLECSSLEVMRQSLEDSFGVEIPAGEEGWR